MPVHRDMKWRSAVAGQFGIRRLPTAWLTDGKTKVSSDTRDVFARVSGLEKTLRLGVVSGPARATRAQGRSY